MNFQVKKRAKNDGNLWKLKHVFFAAKNKMWNFLTLSQFKKYSSD